MWAVIKVFVSVDARPRWHKVENEHFWYETNSACVRKCLLCMLRKCGELNDEAFINAVFLGRDAKRYKVQTGIEWPLCDPLPEPPRYHVDEWWGPLCRVVVARNTPY